MGGRILTLTVTLTTTGVAGSATDSEVTDIVEGEFLDAYLAYHASAPATTDITIKQTNRATGDNILAVANNATSGLYSPRQPVHTATGAAVTNGHDRYPVNGTLTVSAAQCDALTAACVVTIRIKTL